MATLLAKISTNVLTLLFRIVISTRLAKIPTVHSAVPVTLGTMVTARHVQKILQTPFVPVISVGANLVMTVSWNRMLIVAMPWLAELTRWPSLSPNNYLELPIPLNLLTTLHVYRFDKKYKTNFQKKKKNSGFSEFLAPDNAPIMRISSKR